MISLYKNIQLMLESEKGSIIGPTRIDHDDIICNIATYAADTTLYSICDQASDLWQQLEWASDLEFNLWGTVHWASKWLVDFNAGRIQLGFLCFFLSTHLHI